MKIARETGPSNVSLEKENSASTASVLVNENSESTAGVEYKYMVMDDEYSREVETAAPSDDASQKDVIGFSKIDKVDISSLENHVKPNMRERPIPATQLSRMWGLEVLLSAWQREQL